MSISLSEAVKQTLSLGPTKEGQRNYRAMHLAQLYFTGAWDPRLSPILHPRAHMAMAFAQSIPMEAFANPSESLMKAMGQLKDAFPGLDSFYAVDDLCFRWTIGCLQSLVRPELYETYFAPDAPEEFRFLGKTGLEWHFHPYPAVFPGPYNPNLRLLEKLGPRGDLLMPYLRFAPLFLAEVAVRLWPHSAYPKEHVQRLRKVAGMSKKPRQRIGGEAARATRSFLMLHGAEMSNRMQIDYVERSEANPNPIPGEVEGEIDKLRALVAKYRKEILSDRPSGRVTALCRGSLFSVLAPTFMSDQDQAEIHATLR